MTRSIQEIAPYLADIFVDMELDPSIGESYESFLKDNSGKIGLFAKYIGLLHDSWFIETNLTKDKFSIVLNDFTTHIFADAIISKKGLSIEHEKLVFPLHIDFDIAEITFNSVDEKGIIKTIEPTNIDEYLYEQVISVNENNIEMGLIVGKHRKQKPGKHILILLKANGIKVIESQDIAWSNIFGNEYDMYYKYFKAELEKGKYLSDMSNSVNLIEEYDRLYGATSR